MTNFTNFLNGNDIHNFLKKFSRDFHQKIISTNDFKPFEDTLYECINNIYNTETILELMQNHKESEFWFSGIIGFFYQYGIGCDIDENKALESYLLAVNNERTLNQKFSNLYLLEENDDEFYILQNINIGKYLLSLFYYKDIILNKISLNNSSDFVIKYSNLAKK